MMKLSVASLTYNCERMAERHQFCSNESHIEHWLCEWRKMMRLPPLCIRSSAFISQCVYLLNCGSHRNCMIYGVCAPAPRWYAFFRYHKCALALRHVDHIGDGWRATFFFRFISRSFSCCVLCWGINTSCDHVNTEYIMRMRERSKKVLPHYFHTYTEWMCEFNKYARSLKSHLYNKTNRLTIFISFRSTRCYRFIFSFTYLLFYCCALSVATSI